MSASIPRELHDLRQRIDALDDRIIELIAERARIARAVAACKRRHGIAVRLPDRIQAVMERCAAVGAERGLDPNYARQLWSVIIEETCRIEEQSLQQEAGNLDFDRDQPAPRDDELLEEPTLVRFAKG